MLQLEARAKVNLWLKVVGRRSGDGYHLIDSLVAFADLADVIEVETSDRLSLRLGGPFVGPLDDGSENLVLKAARLLSAHARVPAHAALRLTKNIPVAAGLGGGSADAAATLIALDALWRTSLPQPMLLDLAARLGADVPMCLSGRTASVSGVGGKLSPAPALPSCGLLLVNPGVVLPTAEVFAARKGGFSQASPISPPWTDLPDLAAALAARGNDLTQSAIALRPAIADVLAFLAASRGAIYAAMSGSGATCFALYRTKADAECAAAAVPAGWWHHAGVFSSG